ncbi:MAG: hypothetical protein V1493_03545 [Candidatus Diapherotrites archaeon]
MAWKRKPVDSASVRVEKKPERKPGFIRRTGRRVSAKYHSIATNFMSNAIDWSLSEGHINPEKAAVLKEKIAAGQANDFLAGFGAHLALAGIPVITPFMGSIARPAFTISSRVRAKFRRSVSKKTTAEQYKRSAELHSLEAMLIGAIPLFGGGAYVAANFVRDPDLMQALSNYLVYKSLGKNLYKKFKVKYVVELATAGAKRYFVIKVFIAGKMKKAIKRPMAQG